MKTYTLEVRMADNTLKISDEMMEIIDSCTEGANSTTVSKREKRSFKVIGRQDENSILITITTRGSINPTRSLSTLSRKLLENKEMNKILEGHTPNGSVFKAIVIDESNSKITHLSETKIVSEIVSLFFEKNLLPKEKILAEQTTEKIRNIILEHINKKNKL